MKRKYVGFAFILLAVFLNVLLCGYSAISKVITVSYDDGNETVMSYKIPFGAFLKKSFRYGGSYVKFYESEFSGNEKEFLEHLNPDISDDVEMICERAYAAPAEPDAELTESGFVYTEGKDGRKVDKEKLYIDVITSLDSRAVVRPETVAVHPVDSVETLKEKTRFLSSFSTVYFTSGDGRKHNIALAANRINLYKVPARGVFGFNAVVGRRTEENGFKTAHVISDGEYVDGVGGGVCQVSTTLYNAWLTAGKSVLTAATHSLPVSYVSPSLDAMVSEYSDLILFNGSKYPAYIKAVCDGYKITVSVYGEQEKYSCKLRSVTLRKIPAEYEETDADLDWQEGEVRRVVKQATDGVVSEAYRDYYANGKLVKSEKIRTSFYKAIKGIIAVRRERP